MKKIILTIALVIWSFSAFAEAPKRIISLKPNITEILFAIGAGNEIVGVTTWCDKPKAAKLLPKVADYLKPNVEKILALRPDLVITSRENSIKAPIKALEASGIKTLLLPFKNIHDLASSTLILSKAAGREKAGKELVATFRAIKPARGGAQPTILIVVGRRPLVAAGKNTFLGELLEIAGGNNVISGKIAYPHISMETIIAKNPEIIIDMSMGSENVSTWNGYSLQAASNGNIHRLDVSDFRLGPDLAVQVAKLKSLLNKTRSLQGDQ